MDNQKKETEFLIFSSLQSLMKCENLFSHKGLGVIRKQSRFIQREL